MMGLAFVVLKLAYSLTTTIGACAGWAFEVPGESATKQMTTTSASKRAHSTAVTPSSFFRKRWRCRTNVRVMIVSQGARMLNSTFKMGRKRENCENFKTRMSGR